MEPRVPLHTAFNEADNVPVIPLSDLEDAIDACIDYVQNFQVESSDVESGTHELAKNTAAWRIHSARAKVFSWVPSDHPKLLTYNRRIRLESGSLNGIPLPPWSRTVPQPSLEKIETLFRAPYSPQAYSMSVNHLRDMLYFDFFCEIGWNITEIATWDKEALTKVRQSKLSQEELVQLQKETHFDKKELQQWYKGD